jgi:hypothetical protein
VFCTTLRELHSRGAAGTGDSDHLRPGGKRNVLAQWLLVAIALLGTWPAHASNPVPGWLLVSVNEIRVPPPPSLASEREALRRMVSSRTAADVERIRWWDVGGPAYRWNEIAVQAMLDDFVTLPLAARNLALIHAALDDAIAAAAAGKLAHKRARPRPAKASIITAHRPPPISRIHRISQPLRPLLPRCSAT